MLYSEIKLQLARLGFVCVCVCVICTCIVYDVCVGYVCVVCMWCGCEHTCEHVCGEYMCLGVRKANKYINKKQVLQF